MLNAASEGSLSLSGDDDSAVLHTLGVVALSEPDPAMTAMLSSGRRECPHRIPILRGWLTGFSVHSRAALPGEWRPHPQAVQLIWSGFVVAQEDLFASPETAHCQWF